MGYTKNTYIEARRIIDKRAEDAKKLADIRTAEVHSKLPEIQNTDRELANTAAELVAAISQGKENIAERIEKIKQKNLALQDKRRNILLQAGYPEDYTRVKYHCEKCEDTGFTEAGECECLKKELARITIENSGIGNLVNTQSFDNFDLKYYTSSPGEYEMMKDNLEFLKRYAEKFNENTSTNLLFIGTTGLGKTHLSTAVATKVIANGFSVIYDTAQNILFDFEQEKFRRDYSNEQNESKTDKYFSCDLLIIDDLGTELTNSFTVSVIYNLINSRINSKKPVIISTNLLSKEIKQRYEERITSRLLGEFKPVMFFGKDIRMQKLN